MKRDDRGALRVAIDELRPLVDEAERIVALRERTESEKDAAVRSWRERMVQVQRSGSVGWVVLGLGSGDTALIQPLARWRNQTTLSDEQNRLLTTLLEPAANALRDAKAALGARRLFARTAAKESATRAADYLAELAHWCRQHDVPHQLDQIALPRNIVADKTITTADLLSPELGLLPALGFDRGRAEVVPGATFRDLPGSLAVLARAVAEEQPRRAAVLKAAEALKTAETRALLAEMPVKALKEATGERLRFGPIEDAGIKTVNDVLNAGYRLQGIPGVGEKTVTGILAAAKTLWRITFEDMPVRLDITKRQAEATALLSHLAAWDASRTTRGAADVLLLADELAGLGAAVPRYEQLVVVSQPDRSTDQLVGLAAQVIERAAALGTSRGHSSGTADPWDDFLARAADYYAMLAELGLSIEDDKASQGDLPQDIIDAIRDQELRTDLLHSSLRGYQAFAARFVLVQRKVIIGDEMGLGKTVESLAVLAHLRAKGEQHFLVVCPAAVVTNWMREVASKSQLLPRRLHGGDRDRELRAWKAQGGVGVTTYESLAWLRAGQLPEIACLVVDEAHYVKNPYAQRSQRSQTLIAEAHRAVLLTGTPLENRVEEFRTLVRYVRPDLAVDGSELAPRRFRKQVAPAYLRRNQEDVLSELPELVEVQEWLPLSSADHVEYRNAVLDRNFMAMRKAAMLGHDSTKMERLCELVEEAEANGRRVIVFSYFLDVLNRIADELPGEVFGPLTGGVSADKRQQMVDEFSKADHGAVLVAQIVAGGVGLNIQSASVVIICEPQLKPTLESQAIARAHRMGQLLGVQVHRLLTEDSVDERIVEILARKKAIFDEFARDSDTAASSPEAMDITESQLAKEVVEAERLRILAQGTV